MSGFATIVVVLFALISLAYSATLNQTANATRNNTDTIKKHEKSKIDASARTGFHTGVVSSDGWSSGGTSYSSATSIGGQAGILHGDDGSYDPMYNQASQGAQTYQTGSNPPDSYAVATSQMSPGYVGGSLNGGVDNANQQNTYTYEVNSGSWQNLPNSNDYLWHGFNLHPSNSTNKKSKNTTKPK